MIVRVLTARVPPQHVGAFNEKLRGILTELRGQDGLVYAKLARRLDEHDGEEVVLFEEWATPSDLWRWTGGRLGKPRLLPGTEELIGDLVISHFEALDVDPEEMARAATDAAMQKAIDQAMRESVHPTAEGSERAGAALE